MSKVRKSGEPRRVTRRKFLKTAGAAGGVLTAPLLVEPAGKASMLGAKPSPAQKAQPFGPGAVPISLDINGRLYDVKVEPRVTLLEVLRERLGLTGTKRICDHGECGACTVIIDGRAVNACMILAIDAQGKRITTIEGLSQGKALHPLQKAFIDHDSFQCGFCTPGMIMSLKALLDKHPRATSQQIRLAVAGNYCRCGALPHILKAGNAVAKG